MKLLLLLCLSTVAKAAPMLMPQDVYSLASSSWTDFTALTWTPAVKTSFGNCIATATVTVGANGKARIWFSGDFTDPSSTSGTSQSLGFLDNGTFPTLFSTSTGKMTWFIITQNSFVDASWEHRLSGLSPGSHAFCMTGTTNNVSLAFCTASGSSKAAVCQFGAESAP